MLKHLNCPNCNASDQNIDYGCLIDQEFTPISLFFADWEMVCCKCGKTFRMRETYSLTNINLLND